MVPAPSWWKRPNATSADLVVVGARGLGRIRAKVMGSVSDRVIRAAPATLDRPLTPVVFFQAGLAFHIGK